MTTYRVTTSTLDFFAAGVLEKTQGVYLLRLVATRDQAFAVEADVLAHKTVELFAMVGDAAVMPGRTTRVKARAGGFLVDLVCMLE